MRKPNINNLEAGEMKALRIRVGDLEALAHRLRAALALSGQRGLVAQIDAVLSAAPKGEET